MTSDKRALKVAKEWTQKAESDLHAASFLLTLDSAAPTDIICFHAQQCVEKYLKSVLVLNKLPVPKIHDIEKIWSLTPDNDRFPMTSDEMRTLTAYAIDTQYPAFEETSLEEAKQEVEIAERIRRAVREVLLPEFSNL